MSKHYHKFKTGDRVITLGNSRGTVKKVRGTKVTVKLDTSISSELDYEESDLKFLTEDYSEEKKLTEEQVGTNCPKCKTPWTKTKFGSSVWYDCLVCKDKAENLVTIKTENKKENNSSGYSDMSDEIEKWAKMYSSYPF